MSSCFLMKDYNCKKRCGYCCTLRVMLGWMDILRILLHTGYKYSDFVQRNAAGSRVLRMNGNNCYFLEKKKGKPYCRIYEYRPRICREFPFFNSSIKGCEELKKFNRKFSRL